MVREPSIPNSEMASRDEPSGLSGSRAEFAASLKRRLESVLGALSALEQEPSSPGRRDNFLRRVHALASSAKVLGFAAAAEVLVRAEQQIRTSQTDTIADDISTARKSLEEMPGFVLRGPYSLAPPSSATPPGFGFSAPPLIVEPLAVVVWGTAEFIESLQSLAGSGQTLEVITVPDCANLKTACIAHGPDVLLLDANQGSITLLVDELAQAPEAADVPILVANVPDEAAKGLIELGARLVLPARATEQQLCRALLQARHLPIERPPAPIAYGELTLKDLAERLAQEIRQGLVDTATPNAQLESISLGDGTAIRAALWSALAQIREHVIETSDGRIRFASGPEGGVPLAPRSSGSWRRPGPAEVDRLDLTGRRILVADDDPAVAWFVAGTLRAAGAVVTEAHDGSQALELAYRIWPELIVSDVLMPGLDGFALCHAIKRDVLLRDVPVVLLSWKEDLLFRLRDLGADADGYLRKEASASTVVRRVKELLLPRSALERRLNTDHEVRGRLDGTTTRLLLELATALERPVRIALRDATALYELRLRHGSLLSATRTRHDGTVEHAESVLPSMLGITAGRFSVVTDREPCDPMFTGSLQDILRPSVLRARAAQRVLSGLTLGMIDRLTIDPDAFGTDLPMLPMSLRPIADELLRGTAPRQLLASGVASVQLLESLLSDVARRGAVRAIADTAGIDLLEREILLLSAIPPAAPPKPAPSPNSFFSFQLTPATPQAPEVLLPSNATPSSLPDAPPTLAWEGRLAPIRSAGDETAPVDLPSGMLCSLDSNIGSNKQQPAPDATAQHTPTPVDLPSGMLCSLDSDIGSNKQQPAPDATAEHTSAAHRDESDGATPTTRASTDLGVVVPAPVVPLSKPPPTDDVDWAMELSWDSTPPPAGSNPSVLSDIPPSRPLTPGGFMRPSLATPERHSIQETPDLANAVVRAVSEATPQPGQYATPTLGSPDPHPLPIPTTSAPTSAVSHTPSAPSPTQKTSQDAASGAAAIHVTPLGSDTSPSAIVPTSNRSEDVANWPTAVRVAPVDSDPITNTSTSSAITAHDNVAQDSHGPGLSTAAAAFPPSNTPPTQVVTAASQFKVAATPLASALDIAMAQNHPPASVTSPNATAPVRRDSVVSASGADFPAAASTASASIATPPTELGIVSTSGSPTAAGPPGQTSPDQSTAREPASPTTDGHFPGGANGPTESPPAAHDHWHREITPNQPTTTVPGETLAGTTLSARYPEHLLQPPPTEPGPAEHKPYAHQGTDNGSTSAALHPTDRELLALHRSAPGESPAALPVVHQPPRPQLQVPPVEDRRAANPTEHDSEDPVFPLVSAASVSIEAQPSIDVGTSGSQGQIKPASPPPQPDVPPADPPQPNLAVANPVQSEAPLNRDTLRSPSDSIPFDQSPRSAHGHVDSPVSAGQDEPTSAHRAGSADPAPASATSDQPRPGVVSQRGPRSPSAGRSPFPPSPLPQAPRPVGWIQALGLAALAGILTFAVTVPIASWIRKRQEPALSEPPVAQETISTASIAAAASTPSQSTSDNPEPFNNSTANLGAAAPSAAASSLAERSQPIPSATVEDAPLPAEQSLQPGQALIEVKTGGGHAIFVDDAFVGRGPIRVVTVQSGRHIVRTRLNGVERTDSVEVAAGRSLLISLEQTWK